jgi:glycosyltransferase involved in cell wall biosynthesis
MPNNPRISVIMPVYNAGLYVREAIQSILDQTFSDFEFIIIDDGSDDDTLQIIESFKDYRINILKNPSNIGNYPSRNIGLNIAKGKYICVMDADDVALKQRMDIQFRFMEEHPEIGLSGSGFRYFGKKQEIFREDDYEKIKIILLRNNCFIHPTLIIRHDLIIKYNLYYDEKYYYAADYDFIARASAFFKITNIPEALLNYRVHTLQISTRWRQEQIKFADQITLEQLKNLGIVPNKNEIDLHLKLMKGIPIGYQFSSQLNSWINKIILTNKKFNFYNNVKLESFLDSLKSKQKFCKNSPVYYSQKPNFCRATKYNMADVTFVIRSRIDSFQRKENLDTILHYLNSNFLTNIIIHEVDYTQKIIPNFKIENLQYKFILDKSIIFHKTKYANEMIISAKTPYVAIWDIDSIAPPEQVVESVLELRKQDVVMSYPYDGRFFACNEEITSLYKNLLNIGILISFLPVMPLMHSYNSSGGAFIVNKKRYLEFGGENESIFGWGLEDAERIKRMEVQNSKIFYSSGPLFHLFHPIGDNSSFLNSKYEIQNRKVFFQTCSMLGKDLSMIN